MCDCINLDNLNVCADEIGCEEFYDRQNYFLNCTNSSLHCAAPKSDNSIYTGGLIHLEKCVKIEFLCDGNSECLASGFGHNWQRPLDELGCKSIQINSTKSISGKECFI